MSTTPVIPAADESAAAAGQATPAAGHHAPSDDELLGPAHHAAALEVAPPVRPASGRQMATFAAAAAVVLGALLVVGIVPRLGRARALADAQAPLSAPPSVGIVTAMLAPSSTELTLPGSVEAVHESAIYARVGGYVRRWAADIGARVTGGQLLAEIDAPELDQEARQARAQLAQAQSALSLARNDFGRWRTLAADSVVTPQELEQKQTAYEAATAQVAAAEANLRRLNEMQRYKAVTAPFTGVVTARNLDVGTLVGASGGAAAGLVAGGAQTSGAGSLYKIAQTDTVRVYISVPQAYLASIHPGAPADVLVQEYAGRTFTGHVARTAGAVDPATRTLLTEVQVVNPDGALLPGMYAQVRLRFDRAAPPVIVPATSLFVRADGPQVVVARGAPEGDAAIEVRRVQVGRDYGDRVEITSGVNAGDLVVANPTDDLHDGVKVKTRPAHNVPDAFKPGGEKPAGGAGAAH